MQKGHWQKHLRKMRNIYQKKHEILNKAIRTYMKDNVNIIGEDSGLHILLEIKRDDTAENLIEIAKKEGVKVYPTSKYWMNPNQLRFPLLLLGFGGLNEDEIEQGIKKLSSVWFNA
ncbi:hypothetical protein [Oceanobacillus neutriphilus]|uniref:Uncharacterized protein n=1 Tax=Oceanobacillus neutriphilus TaxID=531815 RepID=A0ABQ2NUK8_9BACI|nr:hypothetical protein [Oceanobacillus neutriphilus]GGP10931.1 hypothetical protein GCM10011346_21010 [Oceanobacillus neutriphilus]